MKNIGTKLLETNRLILRRANLDDASAMFKNWGSDPKVSRYVTWETHKTVADSLRFLVFLCDNYNTDNFYNWIVVEKSTDTPIGTIGVVGVNPKYNTTEIGYCYGAKWWGKGYATEGFKRVIKFLFEEVEVETIYAEHLEANPASGRVMEKCGLTYEGTLRGRILDKIRKKNEDIKSYSITREEYFK